MLSALAFEQAAYGSAQANVVGAHHSQMRPIGLTDTLALRWQFRRPWVDSLRLPAREPLGNRNMTLLGGRQDALSPGMVSEVISWWL